MDFEDVSKEEDDEEGDNKRDRDAVEEPQIS